MDMVIFKSYGLAYDKNMDTYSNFIFYVHTFGQNCLHVLISRVIFIVI